MDEATIKAAIAGLTPQEEAVFRERLAKVSDPERLKQLYTPLMTELQKVIAVHVLKSLASGGVKGMLIPPDITQVLLLMLSNHVAETSDPKLEPGAVSLSISTVVAELTFNLFTERKDKVKGGGRG